MNEELKAALENLEAKLQGANKTEIKNAIEEYKTELDASLDAKMQSFIKADGEVVEELKQNYLDAKEHAGELKQRLNELETKLSKGKNFISGDVVEDFATELKDQLKENFAEIKSISKKNGARLELNDVEIKAVGNMTSAANLTGDVVKTYQGGVARVPSQMVNFADLVPSVASATGVYVVYRETGSEGSISNQSTPGAPKTQIDYDFTEVIFNATYLAGYARFAKQMAQDLPFLTSFLPEAMRRDYFKAENANFYTALKAEAVASTATGTEVIERMIQDIGQLEAADYMVNGVVINPADWATIAITKPSDFSLPQVVAYVNGNLVINGIPVFKASWVDAGEYVVGDWTQAKKIVTDGLSVDFYEQDQDNVIRNLITAKIEARVVLGIDRPDAFILGTTTAPAP